MYLKLYIRQMDKSFYKRDAWRLVLLFAILASCGASGQRGASGVALELG